MKTWAKMNVSAKFEQVMAVRCGCLLQGEGQGSEVGLSCVSGGHKSVVDEYN